MYFPDFLSMTIEPALLAKALGLLAALTGSLTVMLLVARFDLALAWTPATARTLLRYQGAPESSPLQDVGQRLLDRLPLLRLLALEENRRWLALMGSPPSPALVVGQAVIGAAVGLLLALLSRQPLLLIAVLLGFLLPFLRQRKQVRKVRQRLERSLPEITAILAAEMAAGLPPDQALERAAAWTGPMAVLLQQVLEHSRRSGQPIFGRGPGAGALVSTLARYDTPALHAFASQLDTAARKGAAGSALMNALVQTYIVAYQDKSLQAAEKLESQLAVPSVLFFFLPLLLLILVPMMLPVLRVL